MKATLTPEIHIYELAAQIRHAIQKVKFTYPDHPTLAAFPKGSCGDASLLLGEFLYSHGEGDWIYVAANRSGDGHTHAWIEKDGLLVDITADQFDDGQPPVLVTRDKSWHKQFDHDLIMQPARVTIYDESDFRTARMLHTAYERIQQL